MEVKGEGKKPHTPETHVAAERLPQFFSSSSISVYLYHVCIFHQTLPFPPLALI